MADLALQILLSAQDAASNIINNFAGRFNTALSTLSPGMQFAAGTAMAFGAAVIGIGAASVKMAADYQQNMNMVKALTGSNTDEMAQYDQGIKNLAMDAGVAPTKLASGLYQIISSGAKGKQAIEELTLATQDSKIGMTDAALTAESLTNVLANFSWQTKDANLVNGIMLQTVTLGKSTFQQYASTITKAATVSQQYKISLQTMSAAWATLTANGVSAGKASTDYQQLVGLMYGKVGTLTKSLEKNGIAFDQNKFNAMSFGDKVAYLNDLLGQASKKHVQLTGVTLQAAQAITVIGGHMKTYQKDLGTLSDKQAMGQATAKAWATTQGGFNQSMDRMNATLQVVGIAIGSALLPKLTALLNWVSKGVTDFMNWASHSKELQAILHALGVAFSTVGDWISKVADYLNHNAAAMAAFKAMAIGIGGAVLGLIIAGFVALAISAWTAAAGVIAATWPFLAIGAAIAIVIAIIVLMVQHWGQIVSFLKGVWSGFASWFGGIMSSIGSFFHNIWTGIANFFTGLWQGIISGLKNAWNFILNAIKMYLNILLFIWTWPFRLIAALFTWLYAHNTYFKKLIDKIREIVQIGLNWLHNAWQTAINKIIGFWQNLVRGATIVWSAIKKAVMDAVLALGKWEIDQWTKATKWLGDKWNSLKDLMSKAWQAVSGLLSGAWNMFVAKPLQLLWKMIVDFASGWPKQLFQSGVNMIQGFINGMLSMIGKIKDAATNIIKNVASILGFHSPAKEGEGRYIVEWGQGLVNGFSSGVLAAAPTLKANVAMAVKTGISPMKPANIATVSPVRGPSMATGGGGHTFNININGFIGKDKKDVVDYLDAELGKRMRRQTNLVTQRSGGRSS